MKNVAESTLAVGSAELHAEEVLIALLTRVARRVPPGTGKRIPLRALETSIGRISSQDPLVERFRLNDRYQDSEVFQDALLQLQLGRLVSLLNPDLEILEIDEALDKYHDRIVRPLIHSKRLDQRVDSLSEALFEELRPFLAKDEEVRLAAD